MKSAGYSAILSGLLAIICQVVSKYINELYQGYLLASCVGLLLMILFVIAATNIRYRILVLNAIGLSWGFLLILSLLISVQNGRISINWPAMVPGLMAIPLAASILSVPIWLASKKSRKPDA
jgi:hypothetical protein